jgi:hypothetical protein
MKDSGIHWFVTHLVLKGALSILNKPYPAQRRTAVDVLHIGKGIQL